MSWPRSLQNEHAHGNAGRHGSVYAIFGDYMAIDLTVNLLPQMREQTDIAQIIWDV